MQLELPPLRAYRDQVPVLAAVFLQQAALRMGRPAPRLSPEALAVLRGHEFPGNVRELRNAIEHAVVMARGEVTPADLPASMRRAPVPASAPTKDAPPTLAALREIWLAPLETRYLTELLQRGNQHGHDVSPAAQARAAGASHGHERMIRRALGNDCPTRANAPP
jgi:DNA-binding NtrC family response regulator